MTTVENPLLRKVLDKRNRLLYYGLYALTYGLTSYSSIEAVLYLERTLFPDKRVAIGLPIEIREARAIEDLVRGGKKEPVGITIIPAKGKGYAIVSQLATRDFPEDKDPKNLLNYNHRFSPTIDNTPSLDYSYELGISHANGDWEIWTVRPNRHDPNVSGGWLFNAKMFHRNGETEVFITNESTNGSMVEITDIQLTASK